MYMNTKKTAETNDKELYNVSKWKCRIKQLLIYIYETKIIYQKGREGFSAHRIIIIILNEFEL